MNYGIKKSFRISRWWKDFYWCHEGFFVIIQVLLIFLIGIVAILSVVFLSIDTTKPEEVENVHRYKIVVEKINGLCDTLIINSNDTLKFYLGKTTERLIITEKGENFIGISIDCDKILDDVKSYKIIE